MITITRWGKHSIYLTFDAAGRDKLIEAFQAAGEGGQGTVELDEEVLQYIEDRLLKCRLEPDFYPAEMCEVRYGQKPVTIYGFMQKESREK